VALTRARHAVVVFADIKRPSRFVTELDTAAYRGTVSVETAEEQPATVCPQCRAGILVPRSGRWGPFSGCSTYPLCDYKVAGSRPPM